MEYIVKLSYKTDTKLIILNNVRAPFSNNDLTLDIEESEVKNGIKIFANVKPKQKITLQSFELTKTQEYDKNDVVFVNGYQSWTDSREFLLNEKMPNMNKLPRIVKNAFCFESYGDCFFKKYTDRRGVFHGFTYSYIRNNDTYHLWASLNDFNAYTIFNYDVKKKTVRVESDICDLEVEDKFTLLEFIEVTGDEKEVFDLWKKLFPLPRIKVQPTNGFCSWYNYYQNINESIILENLEEIHQAGNKLFQIDDGYQPFVGDFLKINEEKFPNGLKPIVDEIHSYGMKAGVWMAPVACETKSEIAQTHPDWLIKDKNGQPIFAGGNWSKFYGLDIYNPEVREYIKSILRHMVKDNGFDFLKLDFLYSVCLLHVPNKTRAQVMRDTMEFIRENSFGAEILGCGVPLVSAAGLVDYCRIGCDVSLKFDDVWFMKYMHRERISTKLTLLDTISRRHLNGYFFLNDPDVYLLREENMSMNFEQRKSLALINHIFGSIYLTSDSIANYNDEMKEFYKECLKFKDFEYSNVKRIAGNYEFDLTNGDEKYHFVYNIKKGILNYGKI